MSSSSGGSSSSSGSSNSNRSSNSSSSSVCRLYVCLFCPSLCLDMLLCLYIYIFIYIYTLPRSNSSAKDNSDILMSVADGNFAAFVLHSPLFFYDVHVTENAPCVFPCLNMFFDQRLVSVGVCTHRNRRDVLDILKTLQCMKEQRGAGSLFHTNSENDHWFVCHNIQFHFFSSNIS